MKAAALITVAGAVQGVGFRYYAYQFAQQFGLNGYVKNKSNGTVESYVEGSRDHIESYIVALRQGNSYSLVENVDFEWCNYDAKYDDFKIKH